MSAAASSRLTSSQLLSKAPYVLAAVALPLAYWTYTDYQAWRGLGPGGVPYNLYGWGLQHFARLARAKYDPRDTKPFEDQALLNSGPCDAYILRRSFLKESLPQRGTERPAIFPWAVPHRQKTQANTSQMRATQMAFMESLVTSRSGVRSAISGLENHGPALFVVGKDSSGLLPQAKATNGEFAHVHQFDGSAHILLSWKDAKSVIDLGWGERHPLGGVSLPMAYTLVYAPADEKELGIWKGILEASIDFMNAAS